METAEKLNRLKIILEEMKSVLISFSGGADSTFLASVAVEVLHGHALAAFADSLVTSPDEAIEAEKLANLIGIRFYKIDNFMVSSEKLVANTRQRCYYCKVDLSRRLKRLAVERGITYIADGSNHDDAGEYRPGRRALVEYGIRSPLSEADLTKNEIRLLSRERGLPTWDKPSNPCLASRIPYGTKITHELVGRIAEGEKYLRSLGLKQVRLRHYGNIARIEVDDEGMSIMLDKSQRLKIADRLKPLGYIYITLDLMGYRKGSMDESPDGTGSVGV